MIIITRTTVDKEYFIQTLANQQFKKMDKIDFDTLSKKDALKILRTEVWWTGRAGWKGDTGATAAELLGDGGVALDEYIECYKRAETYVENNFPNFK